MAGVKQLSVLREDCGEEDASSAGHPPPTEVAKTLSLSLSLSLALPHNTALYSSPCGIVINVDYGCLYACSFSSTNF